MIIQGTVIVEFDIGVILLAGELVHVVARSRLGSHVAEHVELVP